MRQSLETKEPHIRVIEPMPETLSKEDEPRSALEYQIDEVGVVHQLSAACFSFCLLFREHAWEVLSRQQIYKVFGGFSLTLPLKAQIVQ